MQDKAVRMLAILNEGLTCYAERRKIIAELVTLHEKEMQEERADEERLWNIPLDDEWFNERWNALAEQGSVDGFGGHECRRVYRTWVEAGCPHTSVFALGHATANEECAMRRKERAKEVAEKIRKMRVVKA